MGYAQSHRIAVLTSCATLPTRAVKFDLKWPAILADLWKDFLFILNIDLFQATSPACAFSLHPTTHYAARLWWIAVAAALLVVW